MPIPWMCYANVCFGLLNEFHLPIILGHIVFSEPTRSIEFFWEPSIRP